MLPPLSGLVFDLGNSRLKVGRVDEEGRVDASRGAPIDQPDEWGPVIQSLDPDRNATILAASSVHPTAAGLLADWLDARYEGLAVKRIWYQSAQQVPVRHSLRHPERAGADRALAVLAASAFLRPGQPSLVVSCGTAITVERIDRAGIWQGGAIAPGPRLMARALHLGTAQLPEIPVPTDLDSAPPPWGPATLEALTAGVFWGAVGVTRELIARQTTDLGGHCSVLWTGGSARLIAPHVEGLNARILPELVLMGLAAAAFRPEETAA